MKLPEWRIKQYRPETNDYLCTDGEIRTLEYLVELEERYWRGYLFDKERIHLGVLNTVTLDPNSYMGIEYGWR